MSSGSMNLLNCEVYQRGRVSRVADTELILSIAHLTRLPGSIPGVGWVRRNQTKNWRGYQFIQEINWYPIQGMNWYPVQCMNVYPAVYELIPCTVYEFIPCTVYELVPCTVYEFIPCTVHELVPYTVYELVPCTVYEFIPCTVYELIPCTVHELVPCTVYHWREASYVVLYPSHPLEDKISLLHYLLCCITIQPFKNSGKILECHVLTVSFILYLNKYT